MSKEKNDSTQVMWVVRKVIWLILALVTISTLYSILSPLLPNKDEYVGSFPKNFAANFDKWWREILPRRVLLFNEYYNIPWILFILSNVFLLLLVASIRKVIKTPGLLDKPEKLREHYLGWAVSSLLITIVFITKGLSADNVFKVGLGILSLSLSIIILWFTPKILRKKRLRKT